MGGFAADVPAIEGCADALARLRERAANIVALAEDADPEWYIWGLPGLVFAPIYWAFADDLHHLLALMEQSLDEKAYALQCTAQAYRDVDDHHAQQFQGLHQRLG